MTITNDGEGLVRLVIDALVARAAHEWSEAIAHPRCWKCKEEVGEYEYDDVCPFCGEDLVPF
jgi:hypothetical protein